GIPGSGDMNCDGQVNVPDIDLFVAALLNRGVIGQPFCDLTRADTNGDTLINGADIPRFVGCLLAGCP
ncbi:MAG: hypothetical protein ACE5F9_13170, partial [Phycisphaerae bacterium]